MADFQWDEAKREANRLKHGLDFSRAIGLFDGRPIVSFSALSGDEARLVTVGVIAGKFCTVVWTWRDERRRIISFRRSRDEEKRQHRQLHGS